MTEPVAAAVAAGGIVGGTSAAGQARSPYPSRRAAATITPLGSDAGGMPHWHCHCPICQVDVVLDREQAEQFSLLHLFGPSLPGPSLPAPAEAPAEAPAPALPSAP